jgi:hypothetical protein
VRLLSRPVRLNLFIILINGRATDIFSKKSLFLPDRSLLSSEYLPCDPEAAKSMVIIKKTQKASCAYLDLEYVYIYSKANGLIGHHRTPRRS